MYRIHNTQMYTSRDHWNSKLVLEFTHQGTLIYESVSGEDLIPSQRSKNDSTQNSTENSVDGCDIMTTKTSCEGNVIENNNTTSNYTTTPTTSSRYKPNTHNIHNKGKLNNTSILNNNNTQFDNTVIQRMNRSAVKSRKMLSTGTIVLHIGKDKNIYAMEFNSNHTTLGPYIENYLE